MKSRISISSIFSVFFLISTIGNVVFASNFKFPFGVFDKSDEYSQFDNQDYEIGSDEWKEYRNKFAQILSQYNINTVITNAYGEERYAKYVLDGMHDNNIQVIFQPGSLMRHIREANVSNAGHEIFSHPAIVAFKIGNEPKNKSSVNKLVNKYARIRNHYDKPIITAMIGELMGESEHDLLLSGETADISQYAWERLNSKVLFARNYVYRRNYGLINWYKEKMRMSFPAWAAHMEVAADDKQWWFIPQLFGKGKQLIHKSYWRFPTSAELNAVIHIALANGARGIVGWGIPTYDYSRKSTRKMLLDNHFKPEVARDGTFPIEQYSIIGQLIIQHGDLLLHHVKSNISFDVDDERILSIGRMDPRNKLQYVYLVNMDTNDVVTTNIKLNNLGNINALTDLYTRDLININRIQLDAKIKFNPGEAKLIKVN